MKEELCLSSFENNHINQLVRGTRKILMDISSLSSIMEGVGGCVVGYEFTRLHRPSLQRVIFGGEEGEVLAGCFNFSTYEGIAKVARVAVGKKRWILKGIFAAIRGRKDRIIFFNDVIKIW